MSYVWPRKKWVKTPQHKLRDLLATPSFRHNGNVNADKETLEWAAAQITMSTCPLDECLDYIKWDDNAEMFINNGKS